MYRTQEEGDRCASVTLDQREFELVYRKEAPKLLSFLRRKIWLEDDRQDMVQEAFMRLVASRAPAARSNPGAYLHGILRHLLADRVRAWTRARDFDPSAVPMVLEVPGPDAEAEINQMRERYRMAVDGLPPRTKEVYLLHRVEELGYKQIAMQLEISVRTVEWHVAEAIIRISKGVSDNG